MTERSGIHDPLVTFVTTDYAGITRGRSITAASYIPGQAKTLGWVPANMSLTPMDLIADPNPWGSAGDLRLLPDDDARFRFAIEGSATALDIVMSDIVELDGTPWICCPRSFLRNALDDLRSETGAELVAAFEHEFQIFGAGWYSAPAFSLQALRQADPFGPALIASLREAGLDPEVFIAEYGKEQFEITMAPCPALAAADRAVVLRETVRELSRNRGWRSSFAPKTSADGIGNGVHIHFSFADSKGRPTTYDAAKPGGVSDLAASFVAGILKHLPALIAFTAPSPISYLRLQPHHWSSSYTWFGDQDREASLRICPINRVGKSDPAKAFNIEYRPADACACPHLALGVMVRAGLEGIRAKLAAPPLFSGDPALLCSEECEALGLRRLPQTLAQALDTLLQDSTVCSWFDPKALETYTGMKRMELKLAGDALDDAQCRRYAEIY
ncbi:glutamine synthetase [Aestuariivirga sp.]|uniref:glutamine synthetase n=1 Tax=Aestuariivirga sp. TaxID=2650926 RepID=UPI0039E36A06